jgi:hypothetical protein
VPGLFAFFSKFGKLVCDVGFGYQGYGNAVLLRVTVDDNIPIPAANKRALEVLPSINGLGDPDLYDFTTELYEVLFLL